MIIALSVLNFSDIKFFTKSLDKKSKFNIIDSADALVAQLDRVSDYGSEGCGFDLCRAHA